MPDTDYAYSATPTRNPLRYMLAIARFLKSKTSDDIVSEVAIIEIGFARSRFGRKLARWDKTIAHLKKDPRSRGPIEKQPPQQPIVLEDLERLPNGSLGQVFAEHCRNRGINPNLIAIPLEEESDWLLNHLYQSHDIWHVITGWSNDEVGEVGLAGFYCGQLASPPFFIFLLGLILIKAVLRREDNLEDMVSAFSTGFHSGRRAQPMFGLNWEDHWNTPLVEMRSSLSVNPDEAADFGEGILAEAA